MSEEKSRGWSDFPEELLVNVFDIVSLHDKRLLHPLTNVCRHWGLVVKSRFFESYQDYLDEIKINLRFYDIVDTKVVVNNLFTCFHLAEYDQDFLFWPKQSADNMFYCSEVRGNCQVISYEITSTYIDFIKLAGSDFIDRPYDCYNFAYAEYNDVSPFSSSRSNEVEIIKKNTYPTFTRSQYTVCVYSLDTQLPRNNLLNYHSNPIRYFLNTNKRLNYATISQNQRYLVLVFSGLIQVYSLPKTKDLLPVDLNSIEPLFSKQQPSVVKFLSIDDNAHVLFLKSLRLGGLSMINLITGEELEFPHFRLDLGMNSYVNNHIIMLSGYQETIVYGLPQKPNFSSTTVIKPAFPTSIQDDDYLNRIKKLKLLQDEVPIWNYFENHINASLEVIVPLNSIFPTDAPDCFVSLIKGYSFKGKSESIFSGSTNDRSIDLVLLVDRKFPRKQKALAGRYLEDFMGDDEDDATLNDMSRDQSDSSSLEDEESEEQDESVADSSFDDFHELESQFKVIPLIFNVQYLSRSSLISLSDDGKRLAVLINNLLYVMNVSRESISLILNKFENGKFETLDLLTMFTIFTDPNDFRLELALRHQTNASSNHSLAKSSNFNIFMIDDLLLIPEFKEQHKSFNNNSATMNSDDDEDEGLLSDELGTTDAESLPEVHSPLLRNRSLHRGFPQRSRALDRKPQLFWQGNEKLSLNFNGNFTASFELERIFDN